MQQTQLYIAAPDPEDFPSIVFGLKESFAEQGVACVTAAVPLPIISSCFDEAFKAAVNDAKDRTQQYVVTEYSIYLTGGSISLSRRKSQDFAVIIVLKRSKVVYATVEPARSCSREESIQLASISADMQKFYPIDGANKIEREEGKQLAEIVRQGVVIALHLIDGDRPTGTCH